MKYEVTLTDPRNGHAALLGLWQALKVRLMNGERVTVEAKTSARTIPQNSLIHPTVKTIAQALGRPTDVESLRQLRYLLLEQWMHETNRPPQFQRSYDGQRWVCVNKGTSDLDKPDCSEFIEWLLATEADVCAADAA